jgi:hypothetical protein
VSRKSGIERGERERVEEYGSASLVYSVPLKFQQQPSALVVPYFFIIFFLDAHFDLREREFSDAAAIFSLHDTRARWIAFKDSYIQGQRSSGPTPHFFSLYCLLVGRKKEKRKKKDLVCAVHAPEPCWNISRALLPSILARLSFSL